MADWTPLYFDLDEHPKFRRLQRQLASDGHDGRLAVFYLYWLWKFTFKYAPDGDLSRFEPYELAAACDWFADHDDQERGQDFVDALVRAGFIDRAKGKLTVHDWQAYGGRVHADRVRRADTAKARRQRRKTPDHRLDDPPDDPPDDPSVPATFRRRDGDVPATFRRCDGLEDSRGEETTALTLKSLQEDQGLGCARARENGGGQRPTALRPDLFTEKTKPTPGAPDPFEVVRARCLAIAAPATIEEVGDLVAVEVERLQSAIARSDHPAVYQQRCLFGYDPPEGLIAALQTRRDRIRAQRFGEPARDGPSSGPSPMGASIVVAARRARAMPAKPTAKETP